MNHIKGFSFILVCRNSAAFDKTVYRKYVYQTDFCFIFETINGNFFALKI